MHLGRAPQRVAHGAGLSRPVQRRARRSRARTLRRGDSLMSLSHSLAASPVALAVLIGAGVSAAQEIKLKLSHFIPVAHNHHANVIVPWAEEVKKRTNGRVEITVFPGAAL